MHKGQPASWPQAEEKKLVKNVPYCSPRKENREDQA